MLIAEWRRRANSERVAYLCPTVQLARQAASHATTYGIDTVVLVGSHRAWNNADVARYERSDAIAVTTYSTIFNSNPHLTDSHVMLLDDAHAGEGFVAGAWSLRIDRQTDSRLYSDVLEMVQPGLDPLYYSRMSASDADPRRIWDSQIISPAFVHSRAQDLDALIRLAVRDTKSFYPYSMLQGQLDRALVYVSWPEILIRPLVAPTFSHRPFADARQRIYMSATVGEGGELERAFGRVDIARLPLPPGWEKHGIGRRFFVFPELVGNSTPDERRLNSAVKSLLGMAAKAVVITPSSRGAQGFIANRIPDGVPVFQAEDVEASMAPFVDSAAGVLVLANRYDGIDLPDDACRIIVLDGLPVGAHLQERFFHSTLGATRVLQERTRARLVQGAGRATRNPSDFALVVILGRELTSFCGRRDVQAATHPEIQAEIEFGLENSITAVGSEFVANISHFLAQDVLWRTEAEPAIQELREGTAKSASPGSTQLGDAAKKEVLAAQAAWRGEWERAVGLATEVIEKLAGGAETRPYQAFWNYLGACWAAIAAEAGGGARFWDLSAELTQRARAAARGTTWVDYLSPSSAWPPQRPPMIPLTF